MEKKFEIYSQATVYLIDEGYNAHVRTDYSGRGMGGDTCIAIVTDAPGPLVGFAIGLACDDLADAELIPRRSDNMGLQMVWY